MIICALTGSPREVFLIIFIILVSIFWMVYAYRFSKSIDEYFDTPRFQLPDEITIEIVKENSQSQTSASQTEPSALPESAAEHLASGDVSRPMQKAGDVPE